MCYFKYRLIIFPEQVGRILELKPGVGDDASMQVLVEIHSSCASRHPLQRAISRLVLQCTYRFPRFIIMT